MPPPQSSLAQRRSSPCCHSYQYCTNVFFFACLPALWAVVRKPSPWAARVCSGGSFFHRRQPAPVEDHQSTTSTGCFSRPCSQPDRTEQKVFFCSSSSTLSRAAAAAELRAEGQRRDVVKVCSASSTAATTTMPSAPYAAAPTSAASRSHHKGGHHGGGGGGHGRRRRRDQSEVSCCLKYVIFGFNVIFWLLGLSILAIGVWAWTEKNTFNNLSLLTNVTLDPAFIFIWTGAITFVIGFTGCVGALRENTALLAAYAVFLAILLLLEMTAGILGFIFKDWIKDQATNGFQAFIVHYRDDPDQQNLIDWIQEGWLQCCGIEGPQDWDRNVYFNCSSASVGSREACGVPFSCCKPSPDEIIKNVQCGYDVRKPDYPGDYTSVIFDRGCLRAGEEWVERNLVPVAGVAVAMAVLQPGDPTAIINEKGCLQAGEEWLEMNLVTVAGVAVGIAFLQILGICFAQNLRADIFAQMAKWHHR